MVQPKQPAPAAKSLKDHAMTGVVTIASGLIVAAILGCFTWLYALSTKVSDLSERLAKAETAAAHLKEHIADVDKGFKRVPALYQSVEGKLVKVSLKDLTISVEVADGLVRQFTVTKQTTYEIGDRAAKLEEIAELTGTRAQVYYLPESPNEADRVVVAARKDP
jgi:hypothetical protein